MLKGPYSIQGESMFFKPPKWHRSPKVKMKRSQAPIPPNTKRKFSLVLFAYVQCSGMHHRTAPPLSHLLPVSITTLTYTGMGSRCMSALILTTLEKVCLYHYLHINTFKVSGHLLFYCRLYAG